MQLMSERITRDEVAHVADLARLALSSDELDRFTTQLSDVLEHAADVEALDLSDVEPMAHPLPLVNVLRPDAIVRSVDRDAVLAEAPDVEEDQFRVPTILGDQP
ncbi:MAG: Asp-tRNA(Asn)/Glu-tRNA(Gln) amidotransferase subunit GatC [Acidobacteria bacterium]|nr:Asp-tRNA(Asn)/Glu-tRNA(Gln) amidotransferase subunit GatC [Acidobacteriota bacterium]